MTMYKFLYLSDVLHFYDLPEVKKGILQTIDTILDEDLLA